VTLARGRHNIWELACTPHRKYIARRRLTGATRGSSPLAGSNRFERPLERTPAAWRADVALLDDMHRQDDVRSSYLLRYTPAGVDHRAGARMPWR
jgi:hypothetical protein